MSLHRVDDGGSGDRVEMSKCQLCEVFLESDEGLTKHLVSRHNVRNQLNSLWSNKCEYLTRVYNNISVSNTWGAKEKGIGDGRAGETSDFDTSVRRGICYPGTAEQRADTALMPA